MDIKISVDIPLDNNKSLVDMIELSRKLRDAVEESLEVARSYLAEHASTQALSEYISSLPVIMLDDFSGELLITDPAAEAMLNMQETGTSGWSIKDALLRSPKARVSKSGNKYITVPFHGNYGYSSFSTSGYAQAYNEAYENQSFKTVSEKSRGWMYPSKPANPIFEKAREEGINHLNELLKDILAQQAAEEY